MTAYREDTGHGTAGEARCRYEQLLADGAGRPESRKILPLDAAHPLVASGEAQPGDLLVYRLLDGVELWRPAESPVRASTSCRQLSRAAAPSLPSTGRTDPRAAFAAHSTGRIGAGAASLTSAAPSGNAGIPPAGHERGLGVAGASDLTLALRATRLPHADAEDVVCAVCGRRTHFDARTFDGRTGHGACLVGLVGR